MLNSEIIKNNIYRYKFIQKFVDGKIFDHQSNTFTTYHSSKILLENNVTEVYSCRTLLSKEIDVRKKHDGKILFSSIKKEDYKLFFDGIISFENLNKEDFSENLEKYYKFLKEDGVLVLAIKNKQKELDNDYAFSINELKEKIRINFNIINIFSQRFLEKSKDTQIELKIGKIRKFIAQILKKIDKNRRFYIKYIQKNATKFNAQKEKLKKIPDEDYIPKYYDKNFEPFYYILICKKNSNHK